MAKLSFSKLNCSKEKMDEIKTITINDQNVEVKQYLPMRNKAEMVNNIVSELMSVNQVSFVNPIAVEVFLNYEIVNNYTNINFTEKQKEDLFKLYDLMESNSVFNEIITAIPESEYNFVYETLLDTIKALYEYKNSAAGIIENISNTYNNTSFDLNAIKEQVGNLIQDSEFKNLVETLGLK